MIIHIDRNQESSILDQLEKKMGFWDTLIWALESRHLNLDLMPIYLIPLKVPVQESHFHSLGNIYLNLLKVSAQESHSHSLGNGFAKQ